MSEVYSWREGTVSVWTGNGATSAVLAYATDITVSFKREFINRRALSGNYYYVPGEERVDIKIGQLMTNNLTLWKIFQSATAVHVKIDHSAYPNGSAGYYAYTGVLETVELTESDAGVNKYNVGYYANAWSGYG